MVDKTGPAKGPDNNKRLLALEAGVNALALALVANGFEVVEGCDPIDTAIVTIKSQAEAVEIYRTAVSSAPSMIATALAAAGYELSEGTDPIQVALIAIDKGADLGKQIDRLAACLLEKHSDAIEGGAVDTAIKLLSAEASDDASAGELAAIARAEAAEKALATANDELAELRNDVEDLTAAKNAHANKVAELNDVIASKGYAPPAPIEEEAEPAAPRERPEHARDFGPAFGSADRDTLAKLIAAGTAFEVSFSNGDHELVEIEPSPVNSAELVGVEGRFMVNPAIVIKGGKYREEIHGAALVRDGQQIAYCEFPEPCALEAGGQRQFVRALVFG